MVSMIFFTPGILDENVISEDLACIRHPNLVDGPDPETVLVPVVQVLHLDVGGVWGGGGNLPPLHRGQGQIQGFNNVLLNLSSTVILWRTPHNHTVVMEHV